MTCAPIAPHAMLRRADHVLCLLLLAPLAAQNDPDAEPGAELAIERKLLGAATGRFGLCALNTSQGPVTIELRAFRIVP